MLPCERCQRSAEHNTRSNSSEHNPCSLSNCTYYVLPVVGLSLRDHITRASFAHTCVVPLLSFPTLLFIRNVKMKNALLLIVLAVIFCAVQGQLRGGDAPEARRRRLLCGGTCMDCLSDVEQEDCEDCIECLSGYTGHKCKSSKGRRRKLLCGATDAVCEECLSQGFQDDCEECLVCISSHTGHMCTGLSRRRHRDRK